MVEFFLLIFSRFPLRKKKHKSYIGKNRTHDFRTNRSCTWLLIPTINRPLVRVCICVCVHLSVRAGVGVGVSMCVCVRECVCFVSFLSFRTSIVRYTPGTRFIPLGLVCYPYFISFSISLSCVGAKVMSLSSYLDSATPCFTTNARAGAGSTRPKPLETSLRCTSPCLPCKLTGEAGA